MPRSRSRIPLPRHWSRLCLALVLFTLAPPLSVTAQAPPAPPIIVSPQPSAVSPEDVHMELIESIADPDGDSHVATDWEIRSEDGATVVWAAYGSDELVHAHFSDGAFQGPLAGARRLEYKTEYLFRVRVQDSSGAWSAWAERPFVTMRLDRMPAAQVRGLLAQPAPRWRTDGDSPVSLPVGAQLILEDATSTALLTLAGTGDGVEATGGALRPEPAALRLRLLAPSDSGLRLPSTRLGVVTEHAQRLTIHLPALMLDAGGAQVLWVSQTGATFYGTAEQTEFNRTHLARDIALPWQLEPGYRLEAANATFQLPTSLAFVPNPGADPAAPRYYVTELHGQIKVVTNDGRSFNFVDDLLNFRPTAEFPGKGELGVIGICLPPDGHDVYATLVYRDQEFILRNKIMRFHSSDGLTATEAQDILVVSGEQGRARASHQIQQCSFGPDGKLYVFVSDGPGPRMAADDGTFNGKVLRLNPDGTAPPDNPRYDPANPTAPISYQYTKGQRNAFGMAWRPSTNTLYLSENGPNLDRLVEVVPGRHYGWDGTDASMRTHALYVWPAEHWSPVGLTFAEGPAAAALPPADREALYVASAGPVYASGPQRAGKAIQQFRLAPDGTVDGQPRLFARYIGEGVGSIADLKLQPDGFYFTDLYLDDGEGGPTAPGGKVWRIRYTGQAGFTPSLTSGGAPATVAFADASTIGGAVAWTWDFGDGATSSEPSPSHTFTAPGRYAVSLTVTAADGATSEALTLITVTDAAGQAPDPAPTPIRLPAAPAPASLFFPETGMGIGGGFKYFWEQHGGLAQFGYPLTNELQEASPTDGVVRTVQYFERARFEYHPEHKETPYETELGLLGRQAMAWQEDLGPFTPVADPGDGSWVAETGHTLRPPFRDYWAATGGLTIYGLPISEAVQQGAPEEGTLRVEQYFERARLEYHPAAPAAAQLRLARLSLGLLARTPPPRLP